MQLCCQVNSKKSCAKCDRRACETHLYGEALCHECFLDSQKTFLEKTPRVGLSFQDFYIEIRRLIPKNYVSVGVEINDHAPGERPFVLTWKMYDEDLGHIEELTPEAVITKLKDKLGLLKENPIDV